MKSFREQTYYELLEVPPKAGPDEVRTALDRALELLASDSIALYALVDPDQADALRARIREAASALLDPVERSRYDRHLGGADLRDVARDPLDHPLWNEEDPPAAPVSGPAESGAAHPTQAALPLEGGEVVWGRLRAEATMAEPSVEADAPPAEARAPERSRVPEISAETEFNGELLRQVREGRGLSLQQVAERTRITRSHLENVEADRYDHLPTTVYLRGILMNLARELKLDPLRVSRTYLLLAAGSGRRPEH